MNKANRLTEGHSLLKRCFGAPKKNPSIFPILPHEISSVSRLNGDCAGAKSFGSDFLQRLLQRLAHEDATRPQLKLVLHRNPDECLQRLQDLQTGRPRGRRRRFGGQCRRRRRRWRSSFDEALEPLDHVEDLHADWKSQFADSLGMLGGGGERKKRGGGDEESFFFI